MWKVCLASSNTVFGADVVVQQNHWICRVRFLVGPPHKTITENFCLTRHTIHSPFSLEQRNWTWWPASTRLLIISVKGVSSLGNIEKRKNSKWTAALAIQTLLHIVVSYFQLTFTKKYRAKEFRMIVLIPYLVRKHTLLHIVVQYLKSCSGPMSC